MKTCPKCGFTDWPYWRNRGNWGHWEEICNEDDFKKISPDLSWKIIGGKTTTIDKFYAYRLIIRKRGNLVVRKALDEYKLNGWTHGNESEKVNKKGNTN